MTSKENPTWIQPKTDQGSVSSTAEISISEQLVLDQKKIQPDDDPDFLRMFTLRLLRDSTDIYFVPKSKLF